MRNIYNQIAEELNVANQQIEAAVNLLDEGASVPFISRYRKEVTGGLDDSQMRQLESRLHYLRELDARRTTILQSISEQGKLTSELKKEIQQAETKSILEDLYLPYKPKRRTKGQIAIDAGLTPLADALYTNPELDPTIEAEKFISIEQGINDNKAALDGAKYILMERFSEDAKLVNNLRNIIWSDGILDVSVVKSKEKEGIKFSDYFAYQEPLHDIPSHRALAIFRGHKEGILQYNIMLGDEIADQPHRCEIIIREHFSITDNGRPADKWLIECVKWAWRVKLLPHLETNLLAKLKENAEEEAIQVFAKNMKDILLAAPAGQRATIGLDPGLRTGVKVAIIDTTGQVVDHTTIYPHAPQHKWDEAIQILSRLCQQHEIELISIGNGTASRETDKLVGELMQRHANLNLRKIVVNEAGASVYSASEFATQELPNLDVTIRGAVSIARRLQDPLAELVKIEPKSIGVGQYQHDVNQAYMARSLDAVVEDCVNAVGVDINTASTPLLRRVSGLNTTIANNIVEFRNKNGAFTDRSQLQQVPRLGDKAFEQSAGFLRIRDGDNPLDSSSIHPEAYPVVTKIAKNTGKNVEALMTDKKFLRSLNPADFIDTQFGIPTITDIIAELDKPGRDPRPEFKTAELKEGVNTLEDVRPEMILEGTVTNVTNFGAFVDIGVHQDGLVHISALSYKFVKEPREVVKAGDIIKVKVMDVDVKRKRISLTMRLDDQIDNTIKNQPLHLGDAKQKQASDKAKTNKQRANLTNKTQHHQTQGTFASLFEQAQKRQKSKSR